MTRGDLKTWVQISRNALEHNFKVIKSLLAPAVKLWAVVKSNAYGHGLLVFTKVASDIGVDGFCVDSVIEGLKLRNSGIKKQILVLGPTLPALFKTAHDKNITITISNFEALEIYLKSRIKPNFHLKIDTGMHRQGFYLEKLTKALKLIRNSGLINRESLTGIYTHFASAKDINYPTFTVRQFEKFQKAAALAEKIVGKKLMRHCAATGATLINPIYHLDAVRIGIGLYGLWPSKELEIQMNEIKFKPVLSWYAIISEIKNVPRGAYIGYDLTERAVRPTQVAVVPIGYWHGFDRKLSGCGEVLINGKRARVLGRVSMDLIVVDITGIKCRVGDTAVIIGRSGKEELTASEIAQRIGTTHYEVITRINPLIERILV